MIRKGDLIMASNKDFTIEELKRMHEDLCKEADTIGEMLKQKEQEAEDRKKAELALEQENRKKELNEARDHYDALLKAYLRDYGSYSTTTNINNDIFPNAFWHSFF